jgi:ABC-type bacteriocin/lantibiotic exporter with double-glycine peptidase domain
MSEIADLMASNDPMVTPVMSLGPAPPLNTSPESAAGSNTAIMHEKQLEQLSPLANVIPKVSMSKSKLTMEQRVTLIVAICAFVVLLPNVQQMVLNQLPVLTSNATLHVLANSVLIAVLFYTMKDHVIDLL